MHNHRLQLGQLNTELCIKHRRDYVYNIIIFESFIYVIIKSIFIVLLLVAIIVDCIILRGKIHLDLKIITVLFKTLAIILMAFFIIEGTYLS